MTEYVAGGIVEGGKLKLRNQKAFAAAMDTFVDGEVIVTIARARATRSQLQNAWYFGQILRLLSEHTGYTVEEMHEYCKGRFNAKTVVIVDEHGEVKDENKIAVSTSRLNKVTFGEYCESIRIWAATDLHVNIPDPDPNWRDKETAA